jgi:hypothetical protein
LAEFSTGVGRTGGPGDHRRVPGLAIAAIRLGLVGHAALGKRLGRNQRFASTGGVLAAGLMGLIGYFLSYRAIFLATAALVVPLLFALSHIQPSDIHFGRACGAPDHHGPGAPPRARHLSVWTNRSLLTFAACVFLFQLANASNMLRRELCCAFAIGCCLTHD